MNFILVIVSPKTAPRNRNDIAWKHCILVARDTRKLQCKYYQKVLTKRVYRLKYHLANTRKDVGAWKDIPDEVKKEIWEIVVSLQKKKNKKASMDDEEMEKVGEKER